MPNMFSDESKKIKIHTHAQTHEYIYKKKEKELPVNLKPQNSP